MKKTPFIRLRWLLVCGAIIWAIGTIAYYFIYKSYPATECCGTVTNAHTYFEIFVRSLSSAFALFTFNIDSNAVDGWLQVSNNASHCPSIILHISAILAGLWTIFFIIQLLWQTIQTWKSQWVNSRKQHNKLYIFWGINSRSIRLARELSNETTDYCLFVVSPNSQENDAHGIERILARSRQRSEMHKSIDGCNASILIAEQALTELTTISADTWRTTGIRIINRYIKNTTSSIHVLLLGEDENANIYNALRLANKTLWANKFDLLTIHCHARRSNVNRTIEDLSEQNKIKVIDSSYLSIELLKKDVKNHPIQFVKLSETNIGTVETPFRSLIIGFSECGQDALRFLYEYSAFVDKDNTDLEDDKRSPFYCDIVDKERDSSAARLFNHARGVFEENYTNGKKQISFHKIDYTSKEFYENVLKEIIGELNYVVIAIGNDREGITLAVDILRYAIKSGRDMKDIPFRIFVRSYEPNMTDFLHQIAKYYNDSLKKKNNESTENILIQIFGDEKDIYTKAMLIDYKLDQQAKTYKKKYDEAHRKHNIFTIFNLLQKEKLEIEEIKWIGAISKRINNTDIKLSEAEKIKYEAYIHKAELLEKDKDDDDETPLSKRLNTLRTYSQDVSNALHFYTKEEIKDHYDKEQKQVPLVRLAQTEHLRWIAAHEIMGYRPYPPKKEGKDILHYMHACMIPWRELLGNSREYDFLTFNELYTQEELSAAIQEAKTKASDNSQDNANEDRNEKKK